MPGTIAYYELFSLMDATRLLRSGWLLHLFINDFQPDEHSSYGQFVEPSWEGYAPRALTQWSTAWGSYDGVVMSQDLLHTFSNGTGPFSDTVYGYFLSGPSSSYVGAERHSGPGVPMLTPGSTYSVQPRVSMGNAWRPPGSGGAKATRFPLLSLTSHQGKGVPS